MPKATVKLPNGTVITVDGTAEEAARIVAAATGSTSAPFVPQPHAGGQNSGKKKSVYTPQLASDKGLGLDIMDVVHLAKTCDEADAIEKKVLDKRGMLAKILLPLYLVHKYKNNAFSLTSGDMNRFLSELSTPISVSNISKTLTGDARTYIVGDKVRLKGRPVGYKIIRKGTQLLDELFSGKGVESK